MFEYACNYAPTFIVNDSSSCVFPDTGYDCDGVCLIDTDLDGVCDIYEIEGCATPFACNYDPEATDDDGTCIFGNTEGGCASDINMDGTVSVSDLLLLLTEFGQGC